MAISKGIVLASTGVGVVGVSGSGLYLMGVFNEKELHLPDSFQKFIEVGNTYCLEEYFPGFILPEQKQGNKGQQNSSGKEITSSSDGKVDSSFFGHVSQYIQPKSCVIVNWDRENYNKNNWKGNFRWLGTFVLGDRGFISFASATTNEEGNKLDLSGSVYFVKREAKEGILHKYKEISSSYMQQRDINEKLPDVGDGIEKEKLWGDKSKNWGFISNSYLLEKICKASESDKKCKVDQLKSKDGFRGRWEGIPTDDGKYSPANWSKSWNKGFFQIHKDVDNIQPALSGVFKNLKGSGEIKSFSGSKIHEKYGEFSQANT